MKALWKRLDSAHYLISPAQDYSFICGSAIFGYLAFGLMSFGVVSITPMAYLMLFILEGTHLFSTATRSFLDPYHRRKLGTARLLQLVPLCAIAPTFFAIGAKREFYILLMCWLHLHISKQHVGFMALYKRKAGEFDDIELETSFYKVMLIAPLIFYLLHPIIGIGGYMIAWAASAVPALWYALREHERRFSWKVSAPKLILVGLTVPLQWLAFGYALVTPDGVTATSLIIAIAHAIQYHRLNILYHSEEAKKAIVRKPWHSFGGTLRSQ